MRFLSLLLFFCATTYANDCEHKYLANSASASAALAAEYVGQELGTSLFNKFRNTTTPIRYFDVRERKQYEVVIHQGLLFQRNSKGTLELLHSIDGEYLFVLSPDSEMYAAPAPSSESTITINEASFLSGRNVMAAGRMKVRNGIIRYLNGASSVYVVTDYAFDVFLNILAKKNVVLTEAVIKHPGERGEALRNIIRSMTK